jgi:hypothetical protein
VPVMWFLNIHLTCEDTRENFVSSFSYSAVYVYVYKYIYIYIYIYILCVCVCVCVCVRNGTFMLTVSARITLPSVVNSSRKSKPGLAC